MKRLLAILILTAAAFAQGPSAISFDYPNGAQLVMHYTAPTTAACTLTVTEPDFPGGVNDVNPSLFHNLEAGPAVSADSDNGGVAGPRVWVIGHRSVELALDGVTYYSRALQTNTTHTVALTCNGVTVTNTPTTANIPVGSTFGPLPPRDLAGNQVFPTVTTTLPGWKTTDPLLGTLVMLETPTGDWGSSYGQPKGVDTGNQRQCYPSAVTLLGIKGYNCLMRSTGSFAHLQWVGTDSTKTSTNFRRMLGVYRCNSNGNIDLSTAGSVGCGDPGSGMSMDLSTTSNVFHPGRTYGGDNTADADVSIKPTASDTVSNLQAVSGGTWTFVLNQQLTYVSQVEVLIQGSATGSTLPATAPVITVTGTYHGVAQSENISFCNAHCPLLSGTGFNYTAVGANKYRFKPGVMFFDSITNVTIANLTTAQNGLLIGIGLGPKAILIRAAYNGVGDGTGGAGSYANLGADALAPLLLTNLMCATPGTNCAWANSLVDRIITFDSNFNRRYVGGIVVSDYRPSTNEATIVFRLRSQDGPAYVSRYNLTSGTFTAGFNLTACPNTRWCGWHGGAPVSDNPVIHVILQQLHGGSATGPYQITLGAAITDTISTTMTVATNAYGGEPISSGAGVAPDGIPYLQDVAVNDYIQLDPGSTTNSEIIKVTSKSGLTWGIARGQLGSTAHTHANAALGSMYCNYLGAPFGGTSDWIWYPDQDAHNTGATGPPGVSSTNFFGETYIGGGHLTFRSPYSIVASGSVRGPTPGFPPPYPSQFGQTNTFSITDDPAWAGLTPAADGNLYQKHPSYENDLAPNAQDRRYFVDAWPMIGGTPPADTICQAACSPALSGQIYKYTKAGGFAWNPATLPYYGVSGNTNSGSSVHWLQDISGPDDCNANPGNAHCLNNGGGLYQMCVPRNPKECYNGSTATDVTNKVVYFSHPTTPGTCTGSDSGTGGGVCIWPTNVFGHSFTQFGLDPSNLISGKMYGASRSRNIIKGLFGYYRNTGGLTNGRDLPDASWLLYPGMFSNPSTQNTLLMYVAKLPPYPEPDGTDRTTFITLPIAVTTATGAVSSRIRIGYYEEGMGRGRSANNRCNQRDGTEDCTFTGGLNTNVNISVLPQSVVYYTVEYLDGGGGVVASSNFVQSVENGTPGGTTPPPPITVTVTPNPGAVVELGTLQFSAVLTNDGTSAGCTWSRSCPDAGGSISVGGLFTAPNSAEVCTVTCTSVADPTKSDTVNVSVSAPVDTTPPSVAITSPAAGNYSGTITFTATCTDNVACTSVQLMLDGVPFSGPLTVAPYTLALDLSGLFAGGHTLGCTGQDAAGNVGTCTNIAITNTTVPSILSFAASLSFLNVGNQSTLTWSTSGPCVNASIDHGIGQVPCNGTANVTPATQTTYTFTATNAAGSVTATQTIYVGGALQIGGAMSGGQVRQ